MVYNLRIHVDPQVQGTQTQPRLFIPGDRVSGKVVLTQQEDEKIENIFIELKGKWKTKIIHHGGQNNTQTHRYELDFYTERQTLFKGPFKMRASSYEYLFAFQIPEKFNYVAGEFSDGNFAPEYSFMGPKPLPPTCMGPYDRNGECEIYYHLTARIPKTFSDWEDKYVLNFSPPRTQPDLVPLLKEANEYNASTYHRHYRLSDEGICRPLMTRESMKETSHHNALTSTVNFTLNAVAPTAIVIGKPYAIDLTVTSPDAATGAIMPDFTLQSWTLILKTKTGIRIPGTFSDHERFLEDHITVNQGTFNVPLQVNTAVRINGMFPKDRVYAPPTFESRAVKRGVWASVEG